MSKRPDEVRCETCCYSEPADGGGYIICRRGLFRSDDPDEMWPEYVVDDGCGEWRDEWPSKGWTNLSVGKSIGGMWLDGKKVEPATPTQNPITRCTMTEGCEGRMFYMCERCEPGFTAVVCPVCHAMQVFDLAGNLMSGEQDNPDPRVTDEAEGEGS